MNNISSFTADRDCAWEFGSTVWEVRVPLTKIFFFSGLLPDNLLKGEDEFMVIGGEYRVRRLRW
jgi:NAD+--dinitrogen-reductase ADP-D-ribosyltransferase